MNTPLLYRVRPHDPAAHLFEVELTVAAPDPAGQALSLPTWIPGSYLIREFAKNIVFIEARSGERVVALTRTSKTSWRAEPIDGPLQVTMQVYAWDLSVRMGHLDETHGYFNGTSLFLRVDGQAETPCRIILEPPQSPRCANWQVATTLPRIEGEPLAFGVFEAPDHEAAIDHPVEMGTFAHSTFMAEGVPHDVAITGRHTVDIDRLHADLERICAHHIRFFDDAAPMDRYLFQVMAIGDGYGGLEHRASTSLICKRDDLPQPGMTEMTTGYRRFLGLCSHEYFHTWNVKRIKPKAYLPYDLSRESYTTLLWAFEGITSYFDDLALVRCGVIDVESYMTLLGQLLTRVWRVPGRHQQSLADSSYYTWTKFYRQDENSPNAIISYYSKGAVVALALDLTLRARTDGKVTLDDVMRALWQRYGKVGIGVPEDGIEALASELCGADLSGFFDEAIRGTEDAPIAEL
ncbi:MAG: putative metalloprotease with PDZ domain, partial [Bradymonadia bacterium]